MAIRNISAINNAVNSVKADETLKVELIKTQLTYYRDFILERSNDIIDAIDTFNYCIEKEFGTRLTDFTDKKVGKIVFADGRLFFQFNNWQKDHSGPYNWFIKTDGKSVVIAVNSAEANINEMIANTLYYKDSSNSERDKVIAPIFEMYGGERRYTCHSAEKPISAVKAFANALPNFLDEFFNKIDKLGF